MNENKKRLDKIAQQLGFSSMFNSVRTPHKGEKQLKDYKGVYIFKRLKKNCEVFNNTTRQFYKEDRIEWYCDWRHHPILGNQLVSGFCGNSLKEVYNFIDKELKFLK